MLETIFGIVVTGVATFYATYLSNKQTGKLSNEAKYRIGTVVLYVSYLTSILLIVTSVIYVFSGLMGVCGVQGWRFELYNANGEIVLHRGLAYADNFEPILFVTRGAICVGISILLIKIVTPLIKRGREKCKDISV